MTLAVNCNSTGPVPVELVEGEHDASALHVDVRIFLNASGHADGERRGTRVDLRVAYNILVITY